MRFCFSFVFGGKWPRAWWALLAAVVLAQPASAKPESGAVLLLTPENGARNATTSELLMIHATPGAAFDATGELTVSGADGSVFEKIRFDSDRIVSLGATRVIVDPRRDFRVGSEYSVRFEANRSDGSLSIKTAKQWRFRVGVQLTETTVHSSHTKRDHRLLVMLPKHYSRDTAKRYPVVYVTDGGLFNRNQYAQIADAIERHTLPELIVVGIGYPRKHGIADIRKFRTRDMCGKSNLRFGQFIRKELLPLINRQYRTDPSNSTLMGNSCGGTFTAATFLTSSLENDPPFRNFIAVAQSHDFDANLKKFKQHASALPVSLYLSIGQKDLPARIAAHERLVRGLSEEPLPAFRFEHRIIPGAIHGEVTSTPSFREALNRLLGH